MTPGKRASRLGSHLVSAGRRADDRVRRSTATPVRNRRARSVHAADSEANRRGFAREIAVEGSDDPAGVSESVECRYQTQGGDEFDVRIERDGEVLRLVVRPAGSSAEVQAISDPDTIAPWPDPPAPLGRSSDPTSDSSRHSTPESTPDSTPDSTRDSTPDSAQAASADPHVSLDPTLDRPPQPPGTRTGVRPDSIRGRRRAFAIRRVSARSSGARLQQRRHSGTRGTGDE